MSSELVQADQIIADMARAAADTPCPVMKDKTLKDRKDESIGD